MKTHTFRGVRYQIVHDEIVEGYAEVPECDTPRSIYVAPNLTPLRHLDRAVHEAAHAAFPFASEEDVALAGHEIARFLWRLGYRRVVGSK